MPRLRPWLALAALLLSSCRSSAKEETKGAEPSAVSTNEAAPSATAAPAQGSVPAAKSPIRLPGVMQPAPWLEEAQRVVAYGEREKAVIVAGGVGWLRWFSAEGEPLGEYAGSGGAQVLEAVDIDGDGLTEVIVGRGRGRGALDAPATLEVLRLGKTVSAEKIPLPSTTRAQVVAAAAVPGTTNELWVASFVSKFEVEVNRYGRKGKGAWSLLETRGRHRVVGDMTVLADGTPVIARMYGDDADADGGVYALLGADDTLKIPSTRGARALLSMPGASTRLAIADGWHKEYGKKAQGLVSLVVRQEGAFVSKEGVNVAKRYGFNRLRTGDLHKVEGAELIASGNGNAVVMLPTRPDLLFELADREAIDAYPIDLSGDSRAEVVIAGPVPAIWSAR